MSEKPDEVFEIGDLVRHRASKKEAVIIAIGCRCSVHAPIAICGLYRDKSQCAIVPNGKYDLSYDFGDGGEEENVDGVLLEKVSE